MPKREKFYTTRAWRALRLRVLHRDNWECQIHGPTCVGVATHADHILSRVEYPDMAMDLNNLRAACAPCNTSAGGRLGNQRRRPVVRVRRVEPNSYGSW